MADTILWTPTRGHLKRILGGRGGVYPFLERLSWDSTVWFDDFMGDLFKGGAAPGAYQSTASGTSAAAAAINTGAVNGEILLDAGTDSGGRSDLSLGLHFQGQLNCAFAARVQLNGITSAKVELGFTDVLSGTDAGAVNVKATPTFNATDCVGWVFDTNDNAYWEGIGAKAGAAATTYEAGVSPVAATYETLEVALIGDVAFYLRFDANGKFLDVNTGTPQTSAVTATTLLTPWLFVQNRSTTQRTLTVDWVSAWQRRTTS